VSRKTQKKPSSYVKNLLFPTFLADLNRCPLILQDRLDILMKMSLGPGEPGQLSMYKQQVPVHRT